MEERRYLIVPFIQKDRVKGLGGKWDPLLKKWWVPMHVPLHSIKQWDPEVKSRYTIGYK